MATPKKPTREEMARGGFNPRLPESTEPKEQFGPLPTDDPPARQIASRSA